VNDMPSVVPTSLGARNTSSAKRTTLIVPFFVFNDTFLSQCTFPKLLYSRAHSL
jgi:hypothetical protein